MSLTESKFNRLSEPRHQRDSIAIAEFIVAEESVINGERCTREEREPQSSPGSHLANGVQPSAFLNADSHREQIGEDIFRAVVLFKRIQAIGVDCQQQTAV